jgi:hypothetical protein
MSIGDFVFGEYLCGEFVIESMSIGEFLFGEHQHSFHFFVVSFMVNFNDGSFD